ncbi:MAG: 3-oxoacyl-[acyl-carrier-protein] synthase III C-terminal domain-containing protein [Anaerolineae bacterium]|nr:3-oxoacyl-[acyl-carrier-protein] synthase III C-terminal domain-containing protein [Anaerolineae bacterium]MDK1081371.1 3-oxoacyl-[acyl-carrier-protein] synthase III C-terminal domain-containing protein [Anaerolineae bacterium]
MSNNYIMDQLAGAIPSFFKRPQVHQDIIQVAGGIPFGVERVSNKTVGIGGAYGTWGKSYDNLSLPDFVAKRIGSPMSDSDIINLSELGFINRHHIGDMSDQEHLELEIEVGSRLLKEAAQANDWDPNEVDAVLIGMSGPVSDDYVEQICERAGIPSGALKVSIHKACDGSVGGLHLALNPALGNVSKVNIAEKLYNKKVLVGGIEGLSRFIRRVHDKNALQIFGNGAGVIGVIPGKTMKFLVGKTHEAYDGEGVLTMRMQYPHSGESLVDITTPDEVHIRVSGLMHEPANGEAIEMAGPMGMVKLFVRNGVKVVNDVYQAYQNLMEQMEMPDKSIAVAIVHHANYKINKLKAKHLKKLGINFPMPWLLSEFGNVSAASNMIAFLRQLPKLKPGDHILFDGFGAGTYYDVLAVSLPAGQAT